MQDRSLFGYPNQGDVVVDASAIQRYVTHVFTWMVAGLGITGSIAWWFASSGLISNLYTETGMSMLGWVVTLAPLGFVLLMNFGFEQPQQALAIIAPNKGITLHAPIFCADRKKEGW